MQPVKWARLPFRFDPELPGGFVPGRGISMDRPFQSIRLLSGDWICARVTFSQRLPGVHILPAVCTRFAMRMRRNTLLREPTAARLLRDFPANRSRGPQLHRACGTRDSLQVYD